MKILVKHLCKDEIEDIDFKKILKDCCKQLIECKGENIENNIKDNVKQLIKNLIKENEIKHLNIQIIGKTGVGKSTPLNAILRENKAEIKKGEPCTMETKCYENDFIRIYDTRGIEISKDFDIEKVFNEALKDIKDKYEKNEPDELIHCLLYCFTGTRFEREEGEIIVKLRKTYEGNKLPIILVLTQDLNGNDETDDDNEDDKEEKEGFKQLYEAINKIIKEKFDESLFDNRESITLIQVLAKNKRVSKHTILPKGLDILIQKSFEKAEYYSKFACLSAINISLEKKIIEDYERIKEKILNEKDKIP